MTALCLCGAAPDPAIACDCGATFCGANHRGEHRQGGCPTLSTDGTLSITKRAKPLVALPPHISVPPVRMAWHDPAPSLAEKARAERDYDLPPASQTDCSQCGQAWEERACGPTHALIAAEREANPARLVTIPDLTDEERAAWIAAFEKAANTGQMIPLPSGVTVPEAEYERLMAVVEAARAFAAVEKTRTKPLGAEDIHFATAVDRAVRGVLAAMDALDKEAGDA